MDFKTEAKHAVSEYRRYLEEKLDEIVSQKQSASDAMKSHLNSEYRRIDEYIKEAPWYWMDVMGDYVMCGDKETRSLYGDHLTNVVREMLTLIKKGDYKSKYYSDLLAFIKEMYGVEP